MHTKKYVLIGLLMASAILLSACASPAMAQNDGNIPSNPRTINVTGNGKIYLTPDIVYISIGVHTENKDAAEAVTANNAVSKKVSDALTSFKIDPTDIKTSNFNIYPQQIYDQSGKVEGILYVVDNSVYVTVRDLSKISSILGKVIEAGANSISGIQFDAADKSTALSEAREAAIADAQSQAEELCKAAGVTMGDVQSINTYTSSSSSMFEAKGMGGMELVASSNVPITPGELAVSVDVNMVFEIK
ncbi:MAG: SIMPL domain-containing protein [Anaerolineales bacterium]|nr:SIMPL domain-containing protein [Anaerolineales bacterium]